jgi:hypothetical protein
MFAFVAVLLAAIFVTSLTTYTITKRRCGKLIVTGNACRVFTLRDGRKVRVELTYVGSYTNNELVQHVHDWKLSEQ